MASAQKAAEDAKKQASKANSELYKLNIGFKNVSVSLDSKTESIGSAKDRAVDLQQRANALATSASNQLSNLLGKILRRHKTWQLLHNGLHLMRIIAHFITLGCCNGGGIGVGFSPADAAALGSIPGISLKVLFRFYIKGLLECRAFLRISQFFQCNLLSQNISFFPPLPLF